MGMLNEISLIFFEVLIFVIDVFEVGMREI